MKNFYQVSQPEFVETMKSWSQPAFRAKQVWGWVYDKGVVDFNEMNDLPVALREKLHGHYTVGDLRLASEQVSKVSAPSTPSRPPHTDIAAPFHTASPRTCRGDVYM
jgi:adenine C2-methylase RlmN of 23S rRNA A2503 and tRNA A37